MTVKTIVFVMLENRSFDHLLGWLSLPPYGQRADIEGLRGPVDPTSQELTEPSYRNFARLRAWRPYIVDRDVALATDVPHGRDMVRAQMHYAYTGALADAQTGETYTREGFMMDGFADAYFAEHDMSWDLRPESMMIFPPNLIPATSFLARGFMVCDRWFCSVPTDTHPNRIMSLTGYTKIDRTQGLPPDHDLVIDWCDQRQIRWRVYSDGFPFIAALRPRRFLFDHFLARAAADVMRLGRAQAVQHLQAALRFVNQATRHVERNKIG